MGIWGKLTEKLIFTCIGVVILGWVGYHIYNYYNNPLEIETAFEYTISHTLEAAGIAVREEQVIDQAVSGVNNFLFEDGARVTVGEPVALFYASAGADRYYKQLAELRSEIDMLEQAQDKTVNNFSNTELINRDIRAQLGLLTEMTGTGDYAELGQVKTGLQSLLNRRLVATGKAEDFSLRIAELRREADALENREQAQSAVVAHAPVTGYFVKAVDGYERRITPDMLDGYEMEDYRRLLSEPVNAPGTEVAGKIVTSHSWIFAAMVSEYDRESIWAGQEVRLEFPWIATTIPSVIQDVVADGESEDAVLLLRCDRISDDLINIRKGEVKIHFDNYTGLRIDTAMIRFQGDVRGVYILEDNQARFRAIDIVYEGVNFVLSAQGTVREDGIKTVRLYDQLIDGMDLYDGKLIQ